VVAVVVAVDTLLNAYVQQQAKQLPAVSPGFGGVTQGLQTKYCY
jgi:hypothetical protein